MLWYMAYSTALLTQKHNACTIVGILTNGIYTLWLTLQSLYYRVHVPVMRIILICTNNKKQLRMTISFKKLPFKTKKNNKYAMLITFCFVVSFNFTNHKCFWYCSSSSAFRNVKSDFQHQQTKKVSLCVKCRRNTTVSKTLLISEIKIQSKTKGY